MNTKLLALYLPQYHPVPENDLWWGRGYTDWDAVRGSGPLFPGHRQPRVPQGGDYYRLDDENTLRRQAETAWRYGIDGFCLYHYYSKGKPLMDTPARLLLRHRDIAIDYCFCWANHDFVNRWFGGDGDILQRQEYGGPADWQRHFHFLLPFFRDERYLKVQNRPVLALYDLLHIPCREEMLRCWNDLAAAHGFGGLYIIATQSRAGQSSQSLLQCPYVDGVHLFEPLHYRANGSNALQRARRRAYTLLLRGLRKGFPPRPFPEKHSVPKAYAAIAARKMLPGELYGLFPDWDNSPRYRRGGSIVFTGGSPALFREYLTLLYRRSCREERPFFFLNAWNEWGESAYLEPDEENGCAWLEAVRSAKEAALEETP